MTKIVVGTSALQSDFDIAYKIKKWIMQLWGAQVITDDQVTNAMYANEKLILIGGWIHNTVSARVNNDFFHFTVNPRLPGVIVGASGNSLGTYVLTQFRNYVIIWGYSAADTVNAGNAYIRQQAWKIPAGITATVAIAVTAGYAGYKLTRRP